MINIINMDNCPLSYKNGSYGGAAGSKDGVVYNNELWMIKFPKNIKDLSRTGGASYSTAPLSEFLGSHIYQILGFPTHETLLVYRRNKIAVACKDFAIDKMLLELRTVKNHENNQLEELLDKSFQGTGDNHFVDLETMLLHLKYNTILNKIIGIKDRFWDQIVVDIFINNNDRNNGNWGILRDKFANDELAPIFDNGGCLQTKISETKIQNILSDIEKAKINALNTQTAYAINNKILSAKEMLKLTEIYPDFCNSVIRIVPLIQKNMENIKELFNSIPEFYLTPNNTKLVVFSENRKKLFLLQLEERLEKLLEPCYNKCLEMQKNNLNKVNISENLICTEQDMIQEISEYVNSGGELVMKAVPENFVKPLQEALMEEEIPFVSLRDEYYVCHIFTKDMDAKAFLKVQKEVFSAYKPPEIKPEINKVEEKDTEKILQIEEYGNA